jgi:membrane associated rhomboid family serine protease
MAESDSGPEQSRARKREPIFNAPLLVTLMAVLLVGLHAATAFSSYDELILLQYEYALVPTRFWAEAGAQGAYPDVLSKLLTLASTSLLHADWMHVLVNSAMLLAFGTPVARALGSGAAGWGKWMLVFVGSVVVGSLAYLLLNDHDATAAVGASGGTSGLVAAAFLLNSYGRVQSPLSRGFLTMTGAFVAMNALLTVMGPQLIGAQLAWQAHAGGYVAGALLMLALQPRGYVQGKMT